MANSAKEKKNKEGRDDNTGLLKRLVEDLAALRRDVDQLKGEPPSLVPTPKAVTGASLEEMPAERLNGLLHIDETEVAKLAYAFASPQKVRIVRILLAESMLSSAQIGERAGLTTGSLYHHLRELTHAGVIEATGRNQHTLTPLGKRTAVLLFGLVPHV